MANNYLQFSEVLEGLTEEEADWIVAVATAACDPEQRSSSPVAEELWGDEDCYFSFRKEPSEDTENPIFETHPFRVWFYSEESDDPHNVARLVQAFFKRFRAGQKCYFTLSWADWCDKLRIGEFGGGALVVTEDFIFCDNASEYIRRKVEELIDE